MSLSSGLPSGVLALILSLVLLALLSVLVCHTCPGAPEPTEGGVRTHRIPPDGVSGLSITTGEGFSEFWAAAVLGPHMASETSRL